MNNKFWRINYIDVIIFVLAICIVSVLFIMNFQGKSQIDFSQKESITLTLRVRDIPLKHSHLIKNGDTVYFSDNEDVFGEIKFVSYDNDTIEFLDKLTNTSKIFKTPDKCSALLLLECDAKNSDGIYSVNGRRIELGDTIETFTPEFSFTSTILKIESNEG